MAERDDDGFGRRAAERPVAPPQRRPAGRPSVEDDPLVELARIVSSQSNFDDIVSGRPAPQQPPVAQPRPRDVSLDLESELLNEISGGYDVPPPPVQARVAPPQPQPPRVENLPNLRLRGGEPQPQASDPRDWDQPAAPAAAAQGFGAARGAAAGRRAEAPAAEAYDEVGYGEGYEADAAAPEYEDDYGYDEEDYQPPRRGRRAMVIGGVVATVVIVGGVVAYALSGGAGGSSTSGPPIIAADETPTKERPAAVATTEDPQNKLIYDRVSADEPSSERLVVPPDEGVDEGGTAAAEGESEASREISRIILPGAPGDDSVAPSTAAPRQDPAEPAALGPRKVRTVIVKPDGTIISSDARPADGSAPVEDTVAEAATAPAQTAQATPLAPPPAAADEAPVPLAPPPQPAASTARAPEPSRAPAAEPAPAALSGGFFVQISSQRTEEQARAAYRNVQRRYPNVMGNRPVDISRVDLGDRGVYYRARVGPWATRDEAAAFCETLRSAGGDCLIPRN
ncbi:SPOR domain-containing protein [Prosthecomicrobium pneumaticum]|uniref:Cell division septation protein DedD n=1 Tax=Prosthecomicrobium pneumaticum TaxID=81895 RepID=A0A7W9FP10_9HYPH|nr:SPOR domain-containing protein [Prosthecomicrobium pneumaticum]MBB5754143.1 cell division septation protein DedD [Prosthecomicrobium pneumaticum]